MSQNANKLDGLRSGAKPPKEKRKGGRQRIHGGAEVVRQGIYFKTERWDQIKRLQALNGMQPSEIIEQALTMSAAKLFKGLDQS